MVRPLPYSSVSFRQRQRAERRSSATKLCVLGKNASSFFILIVEHYNTNCIQVLNVLAEGCTHIPRCVYICDLCVWCHANFRARVRRVGRPSFFSPLAACLRLLLSEFGAFLYCFVVPQVSPVCARKKKIGAPIFVTNDKFMHRHSGSIYIYIVYSNTEHV